MSVDGKLLTDQQLLGSRGIALISERVASMGLVWRPTSDHDVGIDGEIEIRNVTSKRVTGLLIKVQSKAVSNFKNETNDGFDYWPEQRDVDYWLSVNVPVILVVSKPDANEIYWLPVREYVQANPGVKRFSFLKGENTLDAQSISRLTDLAKASAAGIYSPPVEKTENLISNLLPVRLLPERLYIASTNYTDRKKLFGDIAEAGAKISGDFLLKNKQIMSVRDLSESRYRSICDQGTVEDFGGYEWALSDEPERQRDFVQLLNNCLREKFRNINLLFDRENQCYFFKPNEDRKPYEISYHATHKSTDRAVFKIWKHTHGKVLCWRHSAMKAQFYRYDNRWYLEVTPTYLFTRDGIHEHKKHSEYLKEIKEQELNSAIRGQLIMWSRILTDQNDMFRPDYSYLHFDNPLTFKSNVGIEDAAWTSRDQSSIADLAPPSLFDLL